MKKFIVKVILAAALVVMMLFAFASCNKQILDFNYSFDYAYIYNLNGEIIKEGKIDKWTDYDGEQLQITFKDGSIWLTSSIRCDLVKNN